MSRPMIDERFLDTLARDPAKAEDADSAEIERLVQTIVRTAVRQSAKRGLDGMATLTAMIECTARVVIALPGHGDGAIAAGFGDLLTTTIAARSQGLPPGPLDVPGATRGRMQ